MEDQTLIQNYLETGDAGSVMRLFQRYEQNLFQYVWQMLRHQQDTEDATQEAIGKALRALPRYRPEKPFKSWLFRIGHNEAINVIRKRRKIVIHEDPEAFVDEDPDELAVPSVMVDAEERKQALQVALTKLPDSEREVVFLRLYEEIPFKEIAQITDSPLGTVLARMHNAKRRLKELLEPVLAT